MKFSPSNVDDIRRYFERTYCKLPEHGDKLFYLEEVVGTDEGWEVRLKDSNQDVYAILLEEEVPYEMNFALPHRALFPFKNSVLLLERIPARQYKRGINGDNTRLIDVFSGKAVALDFKKLEAFIQKSKYSSVNEALFAKRGTAVVGLALSQRISFYCPEQLFYVDLVPFAKYNREKNIIVPVSDRAYQLFASELKKLVDKQYPTQPLFA